MIPLRLNSPKFKLRVKLGARKDTPGLYSPRSGRPALSLFPLVTHFRLRRGIGVISKVIKLVAKLATLRYHSYQLPAGYDSQHEPGNFPL